MEPLPDEILEDLLLRLPYVAVVSASQVCRKWKQVIDSRSFARSYTGTVKLATKFCRTGYPARTYEIVDSSGNVLRWAEEWESLGSITSHVNGLVIKNISDEDYYVGNFISNKWEQIPNPSECFDFAETAIFDLGGGRHRLVYWTYDNEEESIMTLETGQAEWSIVTRSDRETFFYTNPVVIGNSVFRVHYFDGVLVEYDSVLGKASSMRVACEEAAEAFLDFGRGCAMQELVVWQGGLYFAIVDSAGSDPQTLEIWQISTGDGHATLLSKFELEWLLAIFEVKEVEDEHGVIHFQGEVCDDLETKVSIVYNMAAKAVQKTTVKRSLTRYTFAAIPARLQ